MKLDLKEQLSEGGNCLDKKKMERKYAVKLPMALY